MFNVRGDKNCYIKVNHTSICQEQFISKNRKLAQTVVQFDFHLSHAVADQFYKNWARKLFGAHNNRIACEIIKKKLN